MNALFSKLSPSITDMIRLDHTHVMATFHKFEPGASATTKEGLVKTVCLALEIHAQLEEEIFYPALRAITTGNDMLDKSEPEHDEMRELITELQALTPTDTGYDDRFLRLMRLVIHHVADEETTLLPMAERVLADQLGELGARMTRRRLELAGPRAGEIAANHLKGMPATTMLMAAGGLMAGGYLLKRAFDHRGGMHH